MVERGWPDSAPNQAALVKFPRSLLELNTVTHRIDLIEMSGGSTYLGLVV